MMIPMKFSGTSITRRSSGSSFLPFSVRTTISGLPTDRKSTRLNFQSRLHLVCRLLLEKKKQVLAHHGGRHRGGAPHRAAHVLPLLRVNERLLVGLFRRHTAENVRGAALSSACMPPGA